MLLNSFQRHHFNQQEVDNGHFYAITILNFSINALREVRFGLFSALGALFHFSSKGGFHCLIDDVDFLPLILFSGLFTFEITAANGKFIVIVGEKVVAAFNTRGETIDGAAKNYRPGTFLIQKGCKKEEVIYFRQQAAIWFTGTIPS